MIKLTKIEKVFLDKHGINENEVFDATGLTQRVYYQKMEEENKIVCVGCRPCKKFGHTIRSISGYCLECDPSRLRFIRRHYDRGCVYIAGSISDKVIKIGTTKSPHQRIDTLRDQEYGGISDWELLFYFECPNAGKIEQNIHSKLKSCIIPLRFQRDGRDMETAREIFQIGYLLAKSTVTQLLPNIDDYKPWENTDAPQNYNFG